MVKKFVLGLVCGSIVFTGAVFMNGTPNAAQDIDNPVSIDSNYVAGTAGENEKSSGSEFQLQKLPITQTNNGVEFTVHSIRRTGLTTDFEITIKNGTTNETVAVDPSRLVVQSNDSSKVGASPTNPDFTGATILPGKERHGWISGQALTEKELDSLIVELSLDGSEQRAFSFAIDCKNLKFRTL
ncbi:hypothetical protein AV654_16310 [Paenibacillus elgii]|uniref:DUF4352 domain-containing protein n=1 Tax=Paenibacillus elgii TaxID=189691 RepID=A0A163Y8S9_9BACL|nr:hypothetical protein [Paenibacillus elgii]KZE79048.1 hypothetical protein AV654_16310 [Paenibacillus elgii]